jgi:hypothetical protein
MGRKTHLVQQFNGLLRDHEHHALAKGQILTQRSEHVAPVRHASHENCRVVLPKPALFLALAFHEFVQ